jgi:hypothetical protein
LELPTRSRRLAALPADEQLLYGEETRKLAQIAITLVGTSMRDKHTWSAITLVKNCLQSFFTARLPLGMKMKWQEEYEDYDLSSVADYVLPLTGVDVVGCECREGGEVLFWGVRKMYK